MIDEPVYLEKHNPLWGEYFDRERERIKIALALDSTAIDRIGSFHKCIGIGMCQENSDSER